MADSGWLENIARGVKGLGWMTVPVAGLYMGLEWLFTEWAPQRGEDLLGWLGELLPDLTIDLAGIGLDWARINTFVPIPEALDLGAKFVAIAIAVLSIRFVMKVIPGIG